MGFSIVPPVLQSWLSVHLGYRTDFGKVDLLIDTAIIKHSFKV